MVAVLLMMYTCYFHYLIDRKIVKKRAASHGIDHLVTDIMHVCIIFWPVGLLSCIAWLKVDTHRDSICVN